MKLKLSVDEEHRRISSWIPPFLLELHSRDYKRQTGLTGTDETEHDGPVQILLHSRCIYDTVIMEYISQTATERPSGSRRVRRASPVRAFEQFETSNFQVPSQSTRRRVELELFQAVKQVKQAV